jgi:II/X family phage/plasmid replication protein
MLPSEAEVRDALRCMSTVHGGCLHVESRKGSLYWNAGSSLRCGKAYHKGAHLAYQIRKREAWASVEQVELCNRLLRLELSLRSQFWRERARQNWHECTAEFLEAQHAKYFAPMISALEVTDTGDLLHRLQRVAATDRQANAAYNAWLAIRAEGVDNVRARMHPATFNRHKRLLFQAGLTWADLQCLNRVPLRRRSIEIGPRVHSWFELREAA